MSESLADYDYDLPQELIAVRPPARRQDARMMVLRRDGGTIEHRSFADFPKFVGRGDMVVLNDTRVLPARRFSDDGRVELLLLEKIAPKRWRCLVRPGRKMRVGRTLNIDTVGATVEEILPEGERIIVLDSDVDLFSGGVMPLPPYLGRESDAADVDRYQTVFAREPGAVAAPTAGLHFTPEILAAVPHAFITLHVGLGTFRPVQTENIAAHKMHSERFSVSDETANEINRAARVIAVGTTVVRVLESVARPAPDSHRPLKAVDERGMPAHDRPLKAVNGPWMLDDPGNARGEGFDADDVIVPGGGETDIFIYPPFEFRVVDALLTNFHLPRSTLLMLVSAFAGREFILRAYDEAIRERYRFYSYGDCMLIL